MKIVIVKATSIFWVLLFVLSACSFPSSSTNGSNQTQLPQAEVVFQVSIPDILEENTGLYLEILDEVTGIYFNPDRYSMSQNSDTVYIFRIPLTIGAEINYRYIKIKDSVETESNSLNQPVISRKLIVEGPELVQDTIFGWANHLYAGPVGRLRGQIIDQGNNAPLPDMIINSAGLQTTSSSDGSFILENVPVGTHNVVILSKDGSVIPFQQYASVAENATTPIFVNLTKRDLVKITFVLTVPGDLDPFLPIRMAGNLSALGNPFVLLSAGTANRSDNLPELDKTGKNKYSFSIDLHEGAFLKYKYTQGDGFWNSELDANDDFIIRELIVPGKNTTIYNEVGKFSSSEKGKVDFKVTISQNSPAVESLFLQLNPYDWMEPLPMVQTAPNEWSFSLISPLQLVGNTGFRFCRNGDCENGLSIETGLNFTPSNETQTQSITIDKWLNYEAVSGSPSVDNGGFNVIANSELISGVEFDRQVPQSWMYSVEKGLDDINNLGGKWVIFSPTWSVSVSNPPMIEPVGASDLSWTDAQRMINYIKLKGLQPVLFPQVMYSSYPDFWNAVNKDEGWWQTFYDRYERFIVNYADLAEIMDASAIVIGDPSVAQSMSQDNGGKERWSQLVADVRARFSGQIIGVVTLPSTQSSIDWIKGVDLIYVIFSPSFSNMDNIFEDMSDQLDAIVYPIYEEFQKPIVIGVNFPSIENALSGCVDTNGSCAFAGYNQGAIDLQTQSSLYNAAASTSFSKNWISGLISRGYNPFLKTTDTSSSIYGKPAYDTLWFWYHYSLNIGS